MPTDIKLYQQFGGEKSVFEKDEVQSLKAMCSKGMNVFYTLRVHSEMSSRYNCSMYNMSCTCMYTSSSGCTCSLLIVVHFINSNFIVIYRLMFLFRADPHGFQAN